MTGRMPQLTASTQARAREVYAELALGSLMRGTVRASELRVVGPELSLRLAANGRVELPALRAGFDPEQFMIDKIAIEDGRLALADAASGTTASLEGLWFNGDVRSLLGPAKGEGGFISAGERYGYRLAASRVVEDGSVKLRLGLDPSDRPLAIEADGALRLEDGSPRFEGTLTLARPAVAGTEGRGNVAVPWRATVGEAIREGGETDPGAMLPRLAVYKPFRSRTAPVEFDRASPAILKLILAGGEKISWR